MFQLIFTTWFSISSAKPFSRGSAIIVILFRLFGVSAKHFNEDVSTTVSQKTTTGSATLISVGKERTIWEQCWGISMQTSLDYS